MLLSTYGSNDGHLNGDPSTPLMSYHNSVVGYTWLIALLGSLAFVLVLVSAVMLYYRKSHFTSSLIKGGRGNGGVNGNGGYLAANTSDTQEYHCQQVC